MSDISPIGRPNPAAIGQNGKANRPTNGAAVRAQGRDQVELSQTARLLSRIHEMPDIRQDVVDRVRSQIAEGHYDTPEKLDAALEQMINEELG